MRTSMPECSVIIPVFNKWELTRNCLASLRDHSSGHDLEVIVVDNGSSDATATELAPYGTGLFGDRFGAVVFPENRNFGPACNAGAHAATAPVLFFLNNDTLVTPGWFPPLQSALHANDRLGAVGPLLLYENDTVQHLGVTFGTQGPFHLYCGFPADHPVVAKNRDLQGITGAALMIRSEFFRECGEFFEEYRNGFEDLDLCIQIRRNGKKMRCVPESRIYHLESQTPGRKAEETYNSTLFTDRCGAQAYTDMHHHAMRDGFSVFLSDLLTIACKLQEKDELAITEEALEQDAAVWLRLCLKHPLWIRGREVLAESLERAGKREDALRFRLELVEIEPTRKRYQDLLGFIPDAEDAPWAKIVEKHLATITRLQTSQAYAQSIFLWARRRFRQGGDPFLERAFAAKLQEMYPDRR